MVGKVTTRGQGVVMPGRKTVTTTYAKGGTVVKKQLGGPMRRPGGMMGRPGLLPQPTGVPTPMYKKGGKAAKKKQGSKSRKDESIAMRVKKKRTKKQLKASRDESYGKWGGGKGKGRINK
jgi:hypothetical protein